MDAPNPQEKSTLIEYLWRRLRLNRRAIRFLLDEGPPWPQLWREARCEPLRLYRHLPEVWRKAPRAFLPALGAADRAPGPYLTWADAEYPDGLRELADPPVVIYGAPKLPPFALDRPRIAVVGTRRASDYAKEITGELVSQFRPFGAWVLSGMAWGIDGRAHRQALQSGLSTLGILGTPLLRPPVRSQVDLFMELKRQGHLITELYPGAAVGSFRFPERNRIIAALAQAVVVVEAPAKSGALITAELALELGREVFVVPGPLRPHGNEGGHRLIQDGARLLTHAREIFSVLGWGPTQSPNIPVLSPSREALPSDSVAEQILNLLSRGPLHIDKIIHISQKPAPQVLAAMTRLTLEEWVQELSGGVYKIFK